MHTHPYEDLVDWLITTFRCLPGCKTPELMDLLRHLYTPKEALFAVRAGTDGGTLKTLIEKTGLSQEELLLVVQEMSKKGTIYIEPESQDPIYRPLIMEAPGLIETAGWGDIESEFGKQTLTLWKKFVPIYINEGVAQLPKIMRPWCAVGALPQNAPPHENLFEKIRTLTDDYVGVSRCCCQLLSCNSTDTNWDCIPDCCFSFGELARWAVEQRFAKHICTEKLIENLIACEEKGHIHVGIPGLIVCNCYNHACINMRGAKNGIKPNMSRSNFQPQVQPDLCKSCGECVKRCPVGAIMSTETAQITQDRCLGCGLCAIGCVTNAIKMIRLPAEEITRIEKEHAENFAKIVSISKPDILTFSALGIPAPVSDRCH